MIALLTAVLLIIAAGAAWRGPLLVVRGFRGLTIGIGLGAASAGLLGAHTWLIAFGVIFLAEELYETALLLLILRAQGRERMA